MRQLLPGEVAGVLRATGYGFLGLARDDTPCVRPMAFGYDGDIYLQMNDSGEKYDYIRDGQPATFVVLDCNHERNEWTSIVVEGTLRSVPADRTHHALDVLTENADFGTDLTVWGNRIEHTDPRLFVLTPSMLSGRRFGESYDPPAQPTPVTEQPIE